MDPYRPLVAQGGVSFPYVFFIPKPAHKKTQKIGKLTILQYFYIGYETRGGVDVKPPNTFLEKRTFRDFVLKVLKMTIFGGGNFRFFPEPGS